MIAKKGQEFGATTGRPRRVGWLDGVALRYVVQVNGLDAVVLNKMDILTGLSEVKMCVAYRHPVLGELTELPWSSDVLAACEPVYQTFPGWSTEIPKSGSMAQLPPEAKTFVAAAEAFCGAQITMVGTGPGRDDALYRD